MGLGRGESPALPKNLGKILPLHPSTARNVVAVAAYNVGSEYECQRRIGET